MARLSELEQHETDLAGGIQINLPREPGETTKNDVDQKVRTAAALEEDCKRGQDDGCMLVFERGLE